jgi:hypothetical protein
MLTNYTDLARATRLCLVIRHNGTPPFYLYVGIVDVRHPATLTQDVLVFGFT